MNDKHVWYMIYMINKICRVTLLIERISRSSAPGRFI